jgi:hypothetical protein
MLRPGRKTVEATARLVAPTGHPHDTMLHKRQGRAMNAELRGCAARDSNPEPAD